MTMYDYEEEIVDVPFDMSMTAKGIFNLTTAYIKFRRWSEEKESQGNIEPFMSMLLDQMETSLVLYSEYHQNDLRATVAKQRQDNLQENSTVIPIKKGR